MSTSQTKEIGRCHLQSSTSGGVHQWYRREPVCVHICVWQNKNTFLHFTVKILTKFRLELECGAMPNVMAAQLNIGGALCESSVFPFLVSRRKVWTTPAAEVPCSNAANIGTQDLDVKWILHRAKFRQGARTPKNVYIVYQHRTRPNIAQSLVGLRWVTSLQ